MLKSIQNPFWLYVKCIFFWAIERIAKAIERIEKSNIIKLENILYINNR